MSIYDQSHEGRGRLHFTKSIYKCIQLDNNNVTY